MTQQHLDIIKKDCMKYKGDGLSANLCLLAIVFNAFYFVVVYKINYSNDLYDLLLGVSVIYNLLFMLITFLSSTKVKAYSIKFSTVLLLLSVGQLVRIFVLPTIKFSEEIIRLEEFQWMVLWLVLSSACLVAAGALNIFRTNMRRKHIESVEKGEIDISFLSERS